MQQCLEPATARSHRTKLVERYSVAQQANRDSREWIRRTTGVAMTVGQARLVALGEVQSLCLNARDSAGRLLDSIANNRVALLIFEALTDVENAAQSELSGHAAIHDPMELADALLDHLRRNLDSAFSRANKRTHRSTTRETLLFS